MKLQITFYLDTRRKKKDKLFPLKLRVWNPDTKKAKLFNLNKSYAEAEFKNSWNKKKPTGEHADTNLELMNIMSKAKKVAAKISPFSNSEFEKRFNLKSGEEQNIFYHYDVIIEQLKTKGRVSTADSYRLSKQSLSNYSVSMEESDPEHLSFNEVTISWLDGYESYMLTEKENSIATVGVYLRSLRAVYNRAISGSFIKKKNYPFGKGKYQIKSSKRTKKALNTEQLKQLYCAIPINEEQKRARDFWFFSYACNGMNLKDIARLRYEDIDNDMIYFIRSKTINTKEIREPIRVYLTDLPKQVIKAYGIKSVDQNDLIFDIISDDDSHEISHKRIKNYIRFINQHIKKLSKANGLPEQISYQWARHSYATNAIRHGASMEFMQESLGHENPKTTQNYFAGFEDETKKEFANKLMDFNTGLNIIK